MIIIIIIIIIIIMIMIIIIIMITIIIIIIIIIIMLDRAEAEWFTSRDEVPEKITFTVFKVTGETNTDDLSPAPDAWSRPDIPLHALAMLKMPRDGITDAAQQIAELKTQ